MESKTTSKTSELKAQLIRAWRERWTDVEWAVQIKKVVPRGVSGDVYNLADVIMQQALVGDGANQLMLSYLRHALSAQLVSHAAVLQRIAKYNQFDKPYCVFDLLEFLEGMLTGATCHGKPEEHLLLSTGIMTITTWLFSIIKHSTSTPNVKQKATEVLKYMMKDDFYMAMSTLAKHIDSELYAEACRVCSELEATLSEGDELMEYVRKVTGLSIGNMNAKAAREPWSAALVEYWLAVRLAGDPAASTASLADQLRLFARLKNYPDPQLFAELIRGSLLCLLDANQTPHESQWGAFAFLKVPHLVAELGGRPDTVSSAIELILQHPPLLNYLDARFACNNLECLLGELLKARLVTEQQCKQLLDQRKEYPILKFEGAPVTAGIPKVIICAEPSLGGILKTLSTDYHNIQDALLGMLHQVLTGKTFELIRAVATVQGQLPLLVSRLIRFNEFSKASIVGETIKPQLFDITFLILAAIVQAYGVQAVLESEGNSLFERWARTCMVERRRPKAPEKLLQLSDPSVVEGILQHFSTGATELEAGHTWQEMVLCAPSIMREVLVAWEQGSLLAADVKRILEAVRGRTASLPVVAASWLCAYMRAAPQDVLLKPVNMVQQLMSSPAPIEGAESILEGLEEPWQLGCDIIRKMQRDIQLSTQLKSPGQATSKQPAAEQMGIAWSRAMDRRWIDHNSAEILHCMLDTAGAEWLVSSICQYLVRLRFRADLQRGVDLALAVFHVDIVRCTQEYLAHVLPQLLAGDTPADTIVEPQLSALATLASYSVYTAFEAQFPIETSDEPTAPKVSRDDPSQNPVLAALRQLLDTLHSTVLTGQITQRTHFAFDVLSNLVMMRPAAGGPVLAAIPPSFVLDLLKTLPKRFGYGMLTNLHDVSTQAGRINLARDLCVLRYFHLRWGTTTPVPRSTVTSAM